jgi:ribosomal protein L11 methyltransferase
LLASSVVDRLSMNLTPATHRATFAIGDEHAAKRVVDVLTEMYFEGEAAIAAFERPGGRWAVTLHFADAPDQSLLREFVTNAAGAEIAATLAFDTVAARDWVKASLEDLVPVPAGRFVVHGAHDRERVAGNKLAIEIEAALAFGTGHHGTTRGCLLLLDHLLKAHQPRRVLDLGTGTGVLGIAAAKALKIGVLASDIDALSVAVARDNARLPHSRSAARSTWCWRISWPTRCVSWRRRWQGTSRRRRW